jgi:DNA-binding transcriptional ArsR family regulator
MKAVCSGFFNALSNKARLSILYALREKEMSVNDIVTVTHLEQSLVSHNLALLKKCHFVDSSVKGKQRIYTLNKKTIVPLFELVDKHMSISCGEDRKSCPNGKGCAE